MSSTRKPSPIRLAVCGAMGRMGQRILTLASANPRFQVVGGVEFPGSADIGSFVAGGKAPVTGNLAEILFKTDVVVDFTSPVASLNNVGLAAPKKVAVVVGTTGFSNSQLKKLKSLSRRAPLVFSPNMSRGVNLLFDLVERAGAALADYDIEILEAHHNQKKDAPSGTALKLADIAARASGRSSKHFLYGREGLLGARTKKEIGILSLRAGDIVGDHTVLLSGGGERVELTHRAHSRDALASGALDAALWVHKKKPGLYSMKDVLARR